MTFIAILFPTSKPKYNLEFQSDMSDSLYRDLTIDRFINSPETLNDEEERESNIIKQDILDMIDMTYEILRKPKTSEASKEIKKEVINQLIDRRKSRETSS